MEWIKENELRNKGIRVGDDAKMEGNIGDENQNKWKQGWRADYRLNMRFVKWNKAQRAPEDRFMTEMDLRGERGVPPNRWSSGPVISPALSNGRHPPTNRASQEERPTDVRLVHNSLPRAQARWAEAKLNLLMPHWTSVVAGSSQRAIGLELKVLYMYSSTAPSFGDFFLICWINFILLNWNRWFTGEHDPARTTVVMNIFSVM